MNSTLHVKHHEQDWSTLCGPRVGPTETPPEVAPDKPAVEPIPMKPPVDPFPEADPGVHPCIEPEPSRCPMGSRHCEER